MDLLPVGLKVSGKPVLVVGGGAVALRKVRMLLRCGARVSVVSPAARPELGKLAAARKIVWRRRFFKRCDLMSVNPVMVFACTDRPRVNEIVAKSSAAKRIWVNRADSPAQSGVHIPSVARLGRLTLAIFSGGRSPAFVKYVRRRLERALGSRVSAELDILAEFRRELKVRVASVSRRKRILTRLIEDGTLKRIAARPARSRPALIRKFLEGRM